MRSPAGIGLCRPSTARDAAFEPPSASSATTTWRSSGLSRRRHMAHRSCSSVALRGCSRAARLLGIAGVRTVCDSPGSARHRRLLLDESVRAPARDPPRVDRARAPPAGPDPRAWTSASARSTGLALLNKHSALLPATAARARHARLATRTAHLTTRWPYLGIALALLIAAPTYLARRSRWD